MKHTCTMYMYIVHVKKLSLVTLSLIVCLVLSSCASKEYYLIPSTEVQCQNQSCFTLEQFVTIESSSNAPVNLTFQRGDHSLSSELIIKNKYSISLSPSSDTKEIRIICYDTGRFTLVNITHVKMSNIAFLGCGDNRAIDVTKLIVQECTYLSQNRGITMLELIRTNTIIKITSFHVINNSTTNIVMLISRTSNVTIEGSNLMIEQGSSILAEMNSNVIIINSSFCNSTIHETLLDNPLSLIQVSNGAFTMEASTILNNTGEMIIFTRECTVNITNSLLGYNYGEDCILCLVKSQVFINNLNISGNFGNFSVLYLLKTGTIIKGGLIFASNHGSLLIMDSHVEFSGLSLFKNCTQLCDVSDQSRIQAEGTVTTIQSTLEFYGNITLCENYSKKSGGAIHTSESKVSVHGNIYIANNEAENGGGGAFLYQTNFICHGNCILVGNKANNIGGGIHAVSTIISLSYSSHSCEKYFSSLIIVDNEAEYGGGLYLETNSKLYGIVDKLSQYKIDFSGNMARANGGAIFIRDETYSGTCNSTSSLVYRMQTECFLQALYDDMNIRHNEMKRSITFTNNTAARGSVLYGGLLDRCTVSPMADIYNKSIHRTRSTHTTIDGLTYFLEESGLNLKPNTTDKIASDAVRVCLCQQDNVMMYNCSFNLPTIHVKKSKEFNLTVVAVDQINHTISTDIRGTLTKESSLGEGQQLQRIGEQCTNLTFNISSPHNNVDLVLYPDQSPCKNMGLSSVRIKIKFANCNCSIGFQRSEDTNKCECRCDPTLEPYVTVLNLTSFVRRKNCWISYTTKGTGYRYLIHPKCPYDYCLPLSSTAGIINLNEPNGANAQCNFNRSGLLCGQCKQGYSLVFGSSHCIQCSKQWPGLAAVNVLVGIVNGTIMVLIFLVLNLTVAVGTVNGIVFYANVVFVNRSLFLPFSNKNFFTFFMFALNTKISFERCFYEGMDAYGKAWLLLTFPMYLISLVIIIIIVSKYSSRCASLIGKKIQWQH